SFVGIFVLASVAWVLSEKRGEVRWRPVLWGIGLQLVLGAVVRSPAMSHFFFTVVDGGVRKLLEFSGAGATFVFQSVEPHFASVPGQDEPQFFAGAISPPVKTFAFWILPTIVFFSS